VVESTAPVDGYSVALDAPHGAAPEPCGSLVMSDAGNRRAVIVRAALPRCKTWMPLVARSDRAEQPGRLLRRGGCPPTPPAPSRGIPPGSLEP
jgi:hypothetical protein